MYLEALTLTNFRSFETGTVGLRPFLTVLTGENNGGKTNVLEALRLFTHPADGRRTRFADLDDVRRGATDFSIVARFADLTPTQRGLFATALESATGGGARYGMRYRPPEGRARRGRVEFWAGMHEGAEPEPEARELIRHVHLPALRDAQRELASANPERIAFLLRQIAGADESKIDELQKDASAALGGLSKNDLVTGARDNVSAGLGKLTEGVQPHAADLRFPGLKLRQIARHLRFFLQRSGLDPVDLTESGLGYANLLFLATVLVELAGADDAELTLFLVEEPEAHLHPQLQAATLAYLHERATASAKNVVDNGRPAGAIQVVVTTHSPNLAAAVSCSHVVVLRQTTREIEEAATADQPEDTTDSYSTPAFVTLSHAVAVEKLALDDVTLGKVDRYIDVTRAALLFAPRVMLLEGIAEALLLPAIAEWCRGKGTLTPQQYARFRAATFAAIEGVDFEPYVRLLVGSDGSARIADRVIIVTDGDDDVGADTTPGALRKSKLLELAHSLGAPDGVGVYVSKVTLEADVLAAGNRDLIRAAFLAARPKSVARFDTDVPATDLPDEQGRKFTQLAAATRIRKGDFAQDLATAIKGGAPFTPPEYLVHAIMDLVAN